MKYIGGPICKACEYDYPECEMSSSEILTDSNHVIKECDCYEERTIIKDSVNHPTHYNQGNRETLDTIKDVLGEGFDYYIAGNIIKYVGRYKFKNGVEDLKKAEFYLKRLITEVEEKEIQK